MSTETTPEIVQAVTQGDVAQVRELLKGNSALVNISNPEGFTLLNLAAFFGHKTVLDELLAQGADVNQPSNNVHRVQPIHSAASMLHFDVIKTLLEHGAEVNTRQEESFVALHYAAEDGQLELVELLLQHGADPTIATNTGETARDLALKNGHQQVAERL
jgi:uncharacterized protein